MLIYEFKILKMLHSLFYISNVDLDKVISSYGIVEELSLNKEYLKETIELAMEVAGSSACYISILDSERQYVISSSGMKDFPLLKKESICQFTVSNRRLTIIEDISCDEGTCHLEASQGELSYYAGFPLINNEKVAIGSLCIMDVQSKNLNDSQIRILELVASSIVEKFDTRRRLIKLIKDINKNFKPAECADINCLSGELAHLQSEVLQTKNNMEIERENLKISNRNLSQFAHRIAHDIKAPLRSINSFTQLIQLKNGKDEKLKENKYYEYINSSITQLNRMIDNLLSIAEFKTNISPVDVSISQLIDSVEVLLYERINSNKVKLIKPEIDVQVYGYESLLKQLFQNIIANGIKYSDNEKDSFVKISFELKPSSVLVSISDNGIGIAEENLKTIFEPYQRISNEVEMEGLGIGLDTCKMIIDDMGKELIVSSELGEGSTFSFEIPSSLGQI